MISVHQFVTVIWQYRLHNFNCRLGCTYDIIHRIQQRRLRYFGHITGMANYRYPKIAMEGYVHGQRSKGRPKR